MSFGRTGITTQLLRRVVEPGNIELKERLVVALDKLKASPYPDNKDMDMEDIRELALHLSRTVYRKVKEGEKGKKRVRKSRRDTVNEKRQRLREIYRSGTWLSIKHLAKQAGVCYQTAKSFVDSMRLRGEVQEYEYNHLHGEKDIEKLHCTLRHPSLAFQSIGDIKQLHPLFSRKAITKALKKTGKRYTKIATKPKAKKKVTMNYSHLQTIMATILDGLHHPDRRILFCDEMKLPLYQTSSHAWLDRERTTGEQKVEMQARPESTMLVAMVLCSTTGFESVQINAGDIRTNDFLDFIQTSLMLLDPKKQYRIVADNPQWHKGEIMLKSRANDFLLFNIPGLFQLNLIENAFSAVRAAFRRRPVVESLAEEISQLTRIFFGEDQKEQFAGYTRNLLRTIVRLAEEYFEQS